MKALVFMILCMFLIIRKVKAQECVQLPNPAISDLNYDVEIFAITVDDTVGNDISFEITRNDAGITNEKAASYFTFSITESEGERNLSMSTTSAFENFGKEAYSNGDELIAIAIIVAITCSGQATNVVMTLSVKDSHRHKPIFNQDKYEFSLPMPMVPSTYFTLNGDVTVTDENFSNTDMKFEISPEDFLVTYNRIDNKTFQAIFSPIQVVNIKTEQTYTLAAINSIGNRTEVPFLITTDPEISLDLPEFGKSIYTYEYSQEELNLKDDEVSIKTDKPEQAQISLIGDYAEYFSYQFDNVASFKLIVNSTNSLPTNVIGPIIVVATFTTDALATVAFLINIVKVIPSFTSEFYNGTLDLDTRVINWPQPVYVSDAVKVELSENVLNLFTIDSTTFEIAPTDQLSQSNFDDNSNMIFSITATSATSNQAEAIIIVSIQNINNSKLQFSDVVYRGSYNQESDSNTVTLEDDIEFLGLSDFDGISITAEESYKTNFDFQFDKSKSKWEIYVPNGLSTAVLNENSKLAIVITATNLTESTTAVLILTLPEKLDIEFGKQFYRASYVKSEDDTADQVLLEEPITITGTTVDNIKISLDVYAENFELIFNATSSSYDVNVIKNLNSATLKGPLILTVAADAISGDYGNKALIVLDLPSQDTTSEIQFEKPYYIATYTVDSNQKATVEFLEENIKLKATENSEIFFSLEEYTENFNVVANEDLSYKIEIIQNLNNDTLIKETELTITIIAFQDQGLVNNNTVLIIKLPPINDTSATPEFVKKYYTGDYKIDSTTNKGIITLKESIQIINGENIDLEFSYDGYENFQLESENTDSTYTLNVVNDLNSTIIDKETQLVFTITAHVTGTDHSTFTVIILDLPEKKELLQFGKQHYLAQYVKNSDSTYDIVSDEAILLQPYYDDVQFSFEDYEENFNLDSINETAWKLSIKNTLNDQVLEESQLIITITAFSAKASSTDRTVVILQLPEKNLQFNKQIYIANYQPSLEPSIQLEEFITLNFEGYTNDFDFVFEGYEQDLEIELTENNDYSVKVIQPFNDSVLFLNTELFVTLTAVHKATEAKTSSLLSIRLSSYVNNVFDSDYYEAQYILGTESDLDILNIDNIKIKNNEYTLLTIEGYEDNFKGTCDASTLECSVAIIENLNGSILTPKKNDLVATLQITTKDKYKSGKSVLVVKLPVENANFTFNKSYYIAEYGIQKSDNDMATIQLDDPISLIGNYPTNLDIIVNDFSSYFKFESAQTSWTIKILQNLEADKLINQTDLVTSISASYKNEEDQMVMAEATLIVKLPSKYTVAFYQAHYYGKYVNDNEPVVVLDQNSNIRITDVDNSKIMVDDFSENFEIIYSNSESWTIVVKEGLNSSVLTSYSELNLLMTITKIAVPFGEAALTIQLPTLSFAKTQYLAKYTTDDTIELEDNITIENIDYNIVNIQLTDYADYFEVQLNDDYWDITILKNLPSDIITTKNTLATTLVVTRDADNSILATSILIVSLPSNASTDAIPLFAYPTYSGEYVNSDSPTVNLKEPIYLSPDSPVSDAVITISPGNFSTNFELVSVNGKYGLQVVTRLSENDLDEFSNIVFTLVATSTQKAEGYATLVIALPKRTRDESVHIENREILFSGTYDNGKFTSPSITLQLDNDAALDDISVEITNDLGIDDKYFSYTYENRKLSIEVGELPDEILKNTSVVPLKLAITDKNTQDTIQAVVNIEIKSDGGNNNENSSTIGYIVAISILAVLLLLLLGAGIVYWYLKLRTRTYEEMINNDEETGTKPVRFIKNETKQPNEEMFTKPLRRPTGIAMGVANILPESSSTTDGAAAPSPESERKVVFDENIKEIENSPADQPTELQSVANRRPTKFVFGNPMETSLDRENRRESSDYNDTLGDRSLQLEPKKTVAFDEKVERMHIESTEEPDESSNDASNDDNDDNEADQEESNTEKTEDDLMVQDEGNLPSHILKEIF